MGKFFTSLIVTYAYIFDSIPSSMRCHTPSSAKGGPPFAGVAYGMLLYHSAKGGIHCFGTRFESRELSAPGRLTSELLRTLQMNGCF